MVKNKGSSSQFQQVHVVSVRKGRCVRRKAKITPVDDKRSRSRFCATNTDSSTEMKETGYTKNNFPSGNNRLLKQDGNIPDYAQLPSNSTSQSKIYSTTSGTALSIGSKSNGQYRNKYVHSYINQASTSRVNCSWKSALMAFAGCLLGLIVIGALILPNVLLYLMLPTLFVLVVQKQVNQSNLTEPIIYANHCGGVSLYTRWVTYSTIGISMSINTSHCTFNSTPLYFTSITGINLQHDLLGSSAIYGSSKYGFNMYSRSYSAWSATQLLNYSQTEKWDVSWVGIPH